jgi:phosphoribosylformimino-5-aminoimidazole carboxamide ribotide isomerase
VEEVLPRLERNGASFIVYTDIERDGMQTGVAFDALQRLCGISPLPLIAAGGVATLADVQKLHPLSREGKLQGAISGRALYEGTLDLEEAMRWIDEQQG